MNKFFSFFICINCVLLNSCATISQETLFHSESEISPLDLGLQEATTGVERYHVLLKAHELANKKGLLVDYSGIDSVKLTIPEGAKPIPIEYGCDFGGTVFTVCNKSKDLYLFSCKNQPCYLDVSADLIDRGKFNFCDELKNGKKILVIEDKNPWIDNRIGYSYGHIRKDILLITGGRARNSVIMPYNNKNSRLSCRYYNIKTINIFFSNIVFNRSKDSSFKTFLFDVTGYDDVKIQNVTINTPNSNLVEDQAIHISECTNVKLENVRINGTYSRTDYSGYGISMNCIWNFNADNLYCKGNWGVFGCNNINEARIENSEINRFDIHCYGCDVSYKNVKFFDLYNQYSSVFGDIVYDTCTFNDFIPVLYESSYNTYNKHNVYINNCIFNPSKSHNYLIRTGLISNIRNKRPELTLKYWPKVTIKNLQVNIPPTINEIFIFYSVRKETTKEEDLDYILPVNIDGLYYNYEENNSSADLRMTNLSVCSKNNVEVSLNNVEILPKKESTFTRLLGFNRSDIVIGINEKNNLIKINVKKSKYDSIE